MVPQINSLYRYRYILKLVYFFDYFLCLLVILYFRQLRSLGYKLNNTNNY